MGPPADPPMRIVSVLPSATETVFALGAGRELVGRSAECDFPEAARPLPVVMRPRTLDSDRPSGEIDARVRDSLRRGESLYTLDLAELARLKPDLILTQDLCRVCSVTDREVEDACAKAGITPRILSLSPLTLGAVWDTIEAIGAAIGREAEARRLADGLRQRTRSAGPPGGPRVSVLEWLDPPIESGLWTPELIRSAGARPWGAVSGTPAHRGDWDQLEADPPDLAILSPCSFTVARTLRELEGRPLGERLGRWSLPRGVWIADEAFFSRPGPRLADGRDLVHRLLRGDSPGFPSGTVRPWVAPRRGSAS